LKAVAMGVVAAIAFFWSNRPNPAITTPIVSALKKYCAVSRAFQRIFYKPLLDPGDFLLRRFQK
jgi:hypothetical protein